MKWAQCDKTNPENCKNCSSKCLWLCTASVHNTTQNSSDNLPAYLQTNIAQMLSIRGEGHCWWMMPFIHMAGDVYKDYRHYPANDPWQSERLQGQTWPTVLHIQNWLIDMMLKAFRSSCRLVNTIKCRHGCLYSVVILHAIRCIDCCTGMLWLISLQAWHRIYIMYLCQLMFYITLIFTHFHRPTICN